WRQMGRELDAMGLLAKCDSRAFELLVESYLRWKRCTKNVGALGDVIKNAEQELVANPWATRAEKAWQQFRPMCTEFGITPSSRARVAPVAGDPAGGAASPAQGQQSHDA